MEWVEVRGKTTDVAIEVAMRELGASDRQAVDVEIIQEPEKGFLGFGGQDAVVKVKLRPKSRNRNRNRNKRRRGRGEGGDDRDRSTDSRSHGNRQQKPQDSRSKSPQQNRGGRDGHKRPTRDDREPNKQSSQSQDQPGRRRSERSESASAAREEKPVVEISDQVPVVEEFLTGLVDAFGLEGDVEVGVDDEVIIANVRGAQTEAMVGVRGSTIEAIHELSKTVLQRQTQSSARLRLDVAGYAERRRQALHIYANQLIDQVIEDQDEVTLEPMSAGDRKVIHDAAGEREGVESFSEGESPQRYVVLAPIATAGASSEEE